jgi:hypothetical protein
VHPPTFETRSHVLHFEAVPQLDYGMVGDCHWYDKILISTYSRRWYMLIAWWGFP